MRLSADELFLEACLDRHVRLGGRNCLAALATVDSTNRLARRIARTWLDAGGRPPCVALVARRQTAGRGRRGRAWVSPAGMGIYTSLLFSLTDAEALSSLPLRVPLTLCSELARVGVDCRIKWPNDLVAGGRKLGGVLIEALSGGRAVIVGYGINGGQTEPDSPVAGATSLRLLSGVSPDLPALAVELATTLLAALTETEPLSALIDAYRERSAHRPGERLRCRLGDELLSGVFRGFDEGGRLCLDTGHGERRLGSAELLAESTGGGTSDREAAEP